MKNWMTNGSPIAAILGAVALCASAAPVAAQEIAGPVPHSSELVVGIGKSQVLELPDAYSDLMIADPKIADVLPLNKHSVYVVGKATGSTALTIYGPGRRLLASANVVVSADIQGSC